MDRMHDDGAFPGTRPYHHGDLREALLDAARQILDECPPGELSMREIARRTGVSHAAPYRHFPNRETLLVELAIEGFEELKSDLTMAANGPGDKSDKIARIGAAYLRFVAKKPAVASLMFGQQIPSRDLFPQLLSAADSVAAAIGEALDDSVLGLAVWAVEHGLAMLTLCNVIDLGQRKSGIDILPTRAQSILVSLFPTHDDN